MLTIIPIRKTFLKQVGFALVGSCIPFAKLFAEGLKPPHGITVDMQHPIDCSLDLRNPLYPLTDIAEYDFKYQKGAYPGIIKDVLYEDEPGITGAKGCVASISTPPAKICDATDHHDYTMSDKPDNPDNNISLLRYHVFCRRSSYEDPVNGHDYDAKPLPVVVLFHPGGFQECPDYLPPGLKIICQQLAARGFISITVGYRGGILVDKGTPMRISVQQQLAPYRAIQDGRGGIRSIMKRNPTKHGNKFRFDPDQFFIGGLSAGAVTALGITYYRTQSMINDVYPVPATSLSIEQALGHINADYYYGEPGADLENPTNWPVIRGLLNCWGGITIPKSFDGNTFPGDISDLGTVEKGFFVATGTETAGNINPPIIGFAGANDMTIPFKDNTSQDILNSINPTYRNENVCLNMSGNYVLKDTGPNQTNIYVKQCSAQNMYYVLKELNRFTELYVDCDMAHGIMKVPPDNFDVAGSSEDKVDTYIAIRAAVFFQTIMNVPTSAAYPPFNYRGKSLFRSTDTDGSNITNQRICTQCDGNPASDTCNVTNEDPACDIQ